MTDEHDQLLKDWRECASGDYEDNFRFVRSLKMVSRPERVDEEARELHAEVFGRIDCTRCANCCKTLKPALIEADIRRISKHLGLSRAVFIETYLESDPEETGYRMRALPCPFLADDGRCRIYEQRPKVCREYPHTDKKEFTSRTYMHADNTRCCPAVYHIVREMRRRRQRRRF
jgi:Fe-S-cluster containining protein